MGKSRRTATRHVDQHQSFLIEFSSADREFMIQALVEKVKPLVVEEEHFENRDASITMDIFGDFGLSEL